jgi:hypothetical protein
LEATTELRQVKRGTIRAKVELILALLQVSALNEGLWERRKYLDRRVSGVQTIGHGRALILSMVSEGSRLVDRKNFPRPSHEKQMVCGRSSDTVSFAGV